MTHAEESVTEWIHGLKSGRIGASDKLWNRYVERLARYARNKLVDRRASDEEDVVLSAFNDFLDGVERGRYLELEDREDLWQILIMLTERRTIDTLRMSGALKRGKDVVRGESVFGDAEENSQVAGITGQPNVRMTRDGAVPQVYTDPAQVVDVTEELRRLLDELGDPTLKSIALGRFANKSNSEIADELGVSVRSVERKLAIIRDRWQKHLPEGPQDE